MSESLLYITREAILRHISQDLGLDLSAHAFRLQSDEAVDQPLRSIVKGDGAVMGCMPVYVTSGPYSGFGVKSIVVDVSGARDVPSHRGLVVIYGEEGTTGITALDAGAITQIRTAAASAHATRMLTQSDARVLAILGTGVQARAHVLSMLHVRPIRVLNVWGRGAESAAQFCAWCRSLGTTEVRLAASPAEAVSGSDIICTATASREPFLKAADLPVNCHINAIGASALGFQELDADVYSGATLYTDSTAAVLASSKCVIDAVARGFVKGSPVGIEIGSLRSPVARPLSGVTIFKTVGLAVQDVVFAREVIRREIAALAGL